MTQPLYYKKAAMLEATKDLEPDLYVTYLDARAKHRFTYFDKHEDLLKKINKLEIKGRYYVHEMVLNGQKRKPYLDLEKKFPDEISMKKSYASTIKKLQKDIITVFKTEYKETITIDDILLLNSSGKSEGKWKLSLHIIVSPKNRTLYYTNSKFTDSSAFHLCTSLINLDSFYEDLLDKQVYNSDLNFRIIGSHKTFGDDRCLQPIDPKTLEVIELNQVEKEESDSESSDESENDDSDNESTCSTSESEDESNEETNKDDTSEEEDENITYEELDYMLTYIKPKNKNLMTPKIEQTTKSKKVITFNAPTQTDINKHLLECVKKYHPSIIKKKNGIETVLVRMYNGMYRFDYWDKKELCPISGKVHSGTNGFYVFENERGYYMKCFSESCKGKSKHIGYADVMDDLIDNSRQINQQYLIIGDGIKNNDEKMCEYIIEWLETDDIKTLAVKSPMATGKTTMVDKILDYAKYMKKILWITHRQSLTKQIYGKFKEEKFKSYMELEGSLREYDRIIVQIDSLGRIQDFDEDCITYNIYDLVIIDEIEGNMNHYNSPYINKPGRSARDLFKFMTECIYNAKKLLVIDADFGMRSKLFVDHMGKSIIVNNNYKPMKKCFNVTNNEIAFQENIFEDIENELNICIVSMSATALEKIETRLKEDEINYVLHTSKTDDKLKDKLEDVNNFWIKYQVVLYSPTIESGVDFNKKHFDKIYCIIKNGQMTCSQRAFLQMVGRIRKIEDPNILCFYDGPNILNAPMYTYDDVLSYFRHYETLNGKRIIEDVEYEVEIDDEVVRTRRKKKDISLFDHISIYNEVEQLNKHPNIFLSVLNKLVQRAGHRLKIEMDEKPKKKNKGKKDMALILSEINESEYDIQKLIGKQKKNKLTENDKLVLRKMFFNKRFGIKNTEDEEEFMRFFNDFSKKELTVKKYERLNKYKSMNDNNDDEFDNVNDGKEKTRHIMLFDILNRFPQKNGVKITNTKSLNITMTNDQYVKSIKNIAKNSIYFKNEAKNRALFFKSKGKLKPINKKNQIYYTRIIQSLLNSYGIILVANGQKQINGIRKYSYSLSVDEQIKNIVEFKYGECDKINFYESLF